jgi:hypothetical protein
MSFGVVTCSRSEGDCLASLAVASGVLVVASHGTADKVRQGLDELRRHRLSGLVSFGLGAGIGPAMRPGDLVVADRVVLPSGRSVPTDPDWRDGLLARLGHAGSKVVVAGVTGMDQPPVLVEDKLCAFRATCAALLDGESHLVAEAAEAAGLPLLVIRAVADPAWDEHLAVPPRGFGPLSLVARLVAHPFDMTTTWRFDRHGRIGLETLHRVAGLIPAPPLPIAA